MYGSCSGGLREGTYTQVEGRTEGQVDGSCKDGEDLERVHRQSERQTEGQVDGSCKDTEGLERVHTDRLKGGQRDMWRIHVRREGTYRQSE